jgi:Ca-activated chloride channel family protein
MTTETSPQPFHERRQERGSAMMMVIMMLPVLLGFAALTVDVGYIYLAQSQLQVAADAAALAGVSDLAANDLSSARNNASAIAASNPVAGSNLTIGSDGSAVEVGRWDSDDFVAGHSRPNALRVTLKRTSDSVDGPLPLFFGPVLGYESVDVQATATARLAAVDLVMVLDTSSSMTHDTYYRRCYRYLSRSMCGCGYAPYGYEPIDTLKEAAASFVDDFDDQWDQLGVVTYWNSSALNRSLTDNFSSVSDSIENIDTPDYCDGTRYTNIGAGMQRGMTELLGSRGRAGADKIMVLLSDGLPTCDRNGKCRSSNYQREDGRAYARELADAARNDGIIIFTISLGDGADRELMQYIANRTGGQEFYAQRGTDLDNVFDEIRRRTPIRLTR